MRERCACGSEAVTMYNAGGMLIPFCEIHNPNYAKIEKLLLENTKLRTENKELIDFIKNLVDDDLICNEFCHVGYARELLKNHYENR